MSETKPAYGVPKSMAREWWRQVCDASSGDAASRARLRRCRSTNDVLSIPAGVRLARMLRVMPEKDTRVDLQFARALDLARVLAHVTEDREDHPMSDVGWPVFPGDRREGQVERGPRLSEARFRRLLQTDGGEELVGQFKRLVALMGGRANVAILSNAFLWWDHPDGRTKQQWSFNYFHAASAMQVPAPSSNQPEDFEE